MTPTSGVEFLIWLLIAASILAVLAKYLRIPYTVALVLGGVLLSLFPWVWLSPLQPGQRPNWLTPDVILIIFLPALVFEGSIKIDVRDLIHDSVLLLLLADFGLLLATMATGFLLHWVAGMPISIALLFGALISATDPISVLAIFKDLNIDRRLSVIIEGESLLNDGTAVVLFQILLAGALTGRLSLIEGVSQFVIAVAGGAVLGFLVGYVASRITQTIDDARIEITLTTITAYGSYLLAHHMHLSGVIATAAAGLMVGNLGAKKGMSVQTRTALESFWEYTAFVMNSVIFLLIGLEVRIPAIVQSWRPLLFAIAAVLIGRACSVYLLVPISNLVAENVPTRWQHVIVWGGLRGALALALALSLDSGFPYRSQFLDLAFGVVTFSVLVQGLTLRPLLRALGFTDGRTQIPTNLPAD